MLEPWRRDHTLVVGSMPEELAQHMKDDLALVRSAVKEAGIPPVE